MKTVLLSWVVWGFSTLVAGQLPLPEVWAKADNATRRLDPSAFGDLPESLKAELRRRRCTIPQTFTGGQPHNVIKANFITDNRVDWAVLCSRARRSSILVFRGGDATAVSELAARPDAEFLQVVGAGQIGFSRAIGVALPQYIREHHERYGGPKPPPLTHAGINDAFVEKASVVWYWHQGRWLQLTGAD